MASEDYRQRTNKKMMKHRTTTTITTTADPNKQSAPREVLPISNLIVIMAIGLMCCSALWAESNSTTRYLAATSSSASSSHSLYENNYAMENQLQKQGYEESNRNKEMERLVRLDKYIHKYNYTAPWRVFQGPAPECGPSPDFSKFFQMNGNERSRLQEDKIIYEHFFKHNFTGAGTYVELGAFDGKTEANTRFYDLCLGWKGLLIEGNPRTFLKTRVERPQSHRISFAPSCSAEHERVNQTVEFYAAIFSNSGLPGRVTAYEGTRTIPVPCGPLGPVLEDIFDDENDPKANNKRHRINFFSLDVEGSEPMVLNTIDFHRVYIDIIMIEVENQDCPARQPCAKRDHIRQFMAEKGYDRYTGMVPKSDVFVHHESPLRLSHLHPTAPAIVALDN